MRPFLCFLVTFILLPSNQVGAWVSQPTVTEQASRSSSSLICVSSASSDVANDTDEITKVKQVLSLARELGPVGAFCSEEDQERILQAARALPRSNKPTAVVLSGLHNLVYSAAPGGSSGKIGPFAGKVSQEFVNATGFINAVELGPLKLSLQATREIVDDDRINVFFKETTIELFGIPVVQKPASGGGQWKQIWVGEVTDGGKKKLIRIMETPSLFVLEHDLN